MNWASGLLLDRFRKALTAVAQRKRVVGMQVEMHFKLLLFSIQSKSINTMQQWAEQGAMKKRPERKKDFFLTVMSLVNGILRINGPSYGICSMDVNTWANTSEFFR